ncbi:hypothetical protein SmJEL517_g03562 [Synchytrium microbalum]|uniref:Cytochrome b5 heme-binding domain-containing protein n=1 Tax=Synchytrium microbalum TaxID=1806994 RepID=A0A507BW37_9FUNG|nr:uncharacterized protein SmJEL517_g03562 [Synchytrium microbalum]TPX33580.1 hypothetical protein SmJEL517_g03562 [Synchytrium microbalum]
MPLQSTLNLIKDNPLNAALLAGVAYMIYSLATSGSSKAAPSQHPTVIELRNYTPIELLEYDGRKSKKIFMGVNGRVYDVSRGANFYGPGGPYGNFAGRDASRGLSKGSFDEDMLVDPAGRIDTLENLSRDEWDELRQWAGHFQSKYDHVGFLVENSSS